MLLFLLNFDFKLNVSHKKDFVNIIFTEVNFLVCEIPALVLKLSFKRDHFFLEDISLKQCE